MRFLTLANGQNIVENTEEKQLENMLLETACCLVFCRHQAIFVSVVYPLRLCARKGERG